MAATNKTLSDFSGLHFNVALSYSVLHFYAGFFTIIHYLEIRGKCILFPSISHFIVLVPNSRDAPVTNNQNHFLLVVSRQRLHPVNGIINLHLHPPASSSFSTLQLTNLTEIHDQISGMARCPYNPLHNSTALITSSGELYAATAMDFSGRDPAIYRSLGGLPPLRTAQYNSKWLNGKGAAKLWGPDTVNVKGCKNT